MVVVDHLVKRYPKNPVLAVDDVSFEVSPGEIFGLLGPNGAGKTTTIGVLTTRVRPTSGKAYIGGIDVTAHPVEARRQLAVVPQRNNLDRGLSIRQNLLFHAAYHGVPPAARERRANELLEQFGLIERANDRVDLFSGGQSQRAMIARALMHSPKVLFLDEPSTGLDPAARLFVWDRINELKGAGVSIVLTTHDMDEAATLADRVGIMDRGHVLALDEPTALTRALPGSATIDLGVEPGALGPKELLDKLGKLAGVERAEFVESVGDGQPGGPAKDPAPTTLNLRLYTSSEAPAMIAQVASLLAAAGCQLTAVRLGTPSLEDVFISLTGRALR